MRASELTGWRRSPGRWPFVSEAYRLPRWLAPAAIYAAGCTAFVTGWGLTALIDLIGR